MQVLTKRLSIIDPQAAEFCTLLEQELTWKPFQASTAVGDCSEPPSACSLQLLNAFSAKVSSSYVYEAPVPWLNGFTPSVFEGAASSKDEWDFQAPWKPQASLPDPISTIHVKCVWHSFPLQVCITCTQRCGCTVVADPTGKILLRLVEEIAISVDLLPPHSKLSYTAIHHCLLRSSTYCFDTFFDLRGQWM
jgi:hypothetical protein